MFQGFSTIIPIEILVEHFWYLQQMMLRLQTFPDSVYKLVIASKIHFNEPDVYT